MLLVTALFMSSASAGDTPAGRALTAGAVAVGSEAAGAVGGLVLGFGAASLAQADGMTGAFVTVGFGGLGLVGGTMSSGAFAGVATRRNPLAMTGVTAGVSVLGMVATGFAGAHDGSAVLPVALGTLVAVPVAAGLAAAALPEHHGRGTSVSLVPTFGKSGGGVRLAGTF